MVPLKVKKISVLVGKKINIGENEIKEYQIVAEGELEGEDTIQGVTELLKQSLELKLERWEAKAKVESLKELLKE